MSEFDDLPNCELRRDLFPTAITKDGSLYN